MNTDQTTRAVELLTEVMEWHANPDSGEYNECDSSTCHWCQMAGALIDELQPSDALPRKADRHPFLSPVFVPDEYREAD